MADTYERQGWVRRNVETEPRLGELVTLYKELGYQVMVAPLLGDGSGGEEEGGCTSCIDNDADPGRFKVIYTREGQSKEGLEERG